MVRLNGGGFDRKGGFLQWNLARTELGLGF